MVNLALPPPATFLAALPGESGSPSQSPGLARSPDVRGFFIDSAADARRHAAAGQRIATPQGRLPTAIVSTT